MEIDISHNPICVNVKYTYKKQYMIFRNTLKQKIYFSPLQ